MIKEIVLSDESINSYGFRVLTGGIDVSQYQKNPIILWMHQRPICDTDDAILPIGKMTNLRIDGDRLIGTPIFDETDEFAMKIKHKFENGFINMASIGIDILETSQEPEMLLVGQVKPTVTKCKLREVSIVDIGSNDNALVIDTQPQLKVGDFFQLEFKPQINDGLIEIKQNENMTTQLDYKNIAVALQLAADVTEAEIVARCKELKAENEKLKEEAENALKEKIQKLVNDAINDGKVSADKSQFYIDLAFKAGVETLEGVLSDLKKPTRPTDLINLSDKQEEKLPDWDECDKNGTLFNIKKNNPEMFQQMFNQKFRK